MSSEFIYSIRKALVYFALHSTISSCVIEFIAEVSFEQAREKVSHAFRNKRLAPSASKKSNSQTVKQNEKRWRDVPSVPTIQDKLPMPTLSVESPLPLFDHRSHYQDNQGPLFGASSGGSFEDEFSMSCLSLGQFSEQTWMDTPKRPRLL